MYIEFNNANRIFAPLSSIILYANLQKSTGKCQQCSEKRCNFAMQNKNQA